ncbi:MAG: cytochrome P450 [Bryobacteraceae bacterium]
MNASAPVRPADYDHLLNPTNVQNPFPLYAQLGEESPVHWNSHFGSWLLTRYSDVRSAFADRTRFSSAVGEAMLSRVVDFPQHALSDFEIRYRYFYRQIQALDAPKHTIHRSLIAKAFTPRVIEDLRLLIERRVERLLETVLSEGESDFVAKFAYPLPSLVIFDLLGVPEDYYPVLRASASAFARFPAAIYARDFAVLSDIARHLADTENVLLGLVAARRHLPRSDLISALATVREGADTLTDDEIVVLCNFLLFAGHETTANLLGGSVLHLLQERSLWNQLRDDRALLPNALEELLRFVSPVLTISRVLTEDFECHGTQMKKGDRVQLGVGAANHDPAQFSDSEDLRLDRPNPHSVAFGYGAHYCIGAALARLEAQIALGSLVQHVRDMRLRTETVEYQPVFYLRALKSLPISTR